MLTPRGARRHRRRHSAAPRGGGAAARRLPWPAGSAAPALPTAPGASSFIAAHCSLALLSRTHAILRFTGWPPRAKRSTERRAVVIACLVRRRSRRSPVSACTWTHALAGWLGHRSPLTYQPLRSATLLPNLVVRTEIVTLLEMITASDKDLKRASPPTASPSWRRQICWPTLAPPTTPLPWRRGHRWSTARRGW